MLQKMKNASVTQPISLTIDGHPSPAGRTNRNRKGRQRCFPSHHRGRRRSFSTNPRVDTEITVAKHRTNRCAKSPRVSGVKSNVFHDQSVHAHIQITLLRRSRLARYRVNCLPLFALSCNFAAAIFSSKCASDDVPGIGSITGDRCSSHASPS